MNTLPTQKPVNAQIKIENLEDLELTSEQLDQLQKSGKLSLQCSLNASYGGNVYLQIDNVKVWKQRAIRK